MNCDERLFGFVVSQTNKILSQCINAKFNEEGIGITIEQWPILMMLIINPDSTQQQLALDTNKDKTTVTRIINVMVKNGLLERKVDNNDRRKNKIVVTSKGDETREKVTEAFCNYESQLLSGVTEDEYKTTMSVLLRVVGNIGQPEQVQVLNQHMDNIRKCISKEK